MFVILLYTSRKFIWDMQAVKIGSNKIMPFHYIQKYETLWRIFLKAVVQSLITYSKFIFDYPYPKAVLVHAKSRNGISNDLLNSKDQMKMYWFDRTKFE